MNFLEWMLSFIFPESCEICEKNAVNYLCDQCKINIQKSNIYLNQIDNYEQDKNTFFDEHLYLFSYKDLIRDKIIKYKFGDCPYLYKMFSEFFVKNKIFNTFLKNYDIIIPVPLSKQKMRIRGYNQTELLAKNIAQSLLVQTKILIKYKNNNSQSLLNREERIENVKNVYKITDMQKIKQKNIILFDDVYTTGATINECARVLKEAGANKVGIITIAKEFYKTKEGIE